MNAAVNALYAEYLEYTGGDKAAAASLVLAATLREAQPKAPAQADMPLTVPEVAKLLRVRQNKVLAWIRSGRLRGFNITEKESGRPKYRVNREDLEAFTKLRVPIQTAPAGRPAGSRSVPKKVLQWPTLDKATSGSH